MFDANSKINRYYSWSQVNGKLNVRKQETSFFSYNRRVKATFYHHPNFNQARMKYLFLLQIFLMQHN